MADSCKLVIRATTTDGEKNFSYNYAKSTTSTTNVKAFISALITNGSIFENPPLEAVSAKLVTTTEDEFDISD